MQLANMAYAKEEGMKTLKLCAVEFTMEGWPWTV